ncbi:MAG: hypothetical protein GY944_27225 [bacterium]|nr:hypothetical protein [bacterium]
MTEPTSTDLGAWAARLGDPEEAHRIEAQAMLLAQAEDALPHVLQVFASGGVDTRREAVWFLAHALLEGEAVRAALRRAATDTSLDVRQLAVVAQERLDDPEGWEADLAAQFEFLQSLGEDGLSSDQ